MFDMQLDQSETMLNSSYYCGHCAAEMMGKGNILECPICSVKYRIEL